MTTGTYDCLIIASIGAFVCVVAIATNTRKGPSYEDAYVITGLVIAAAIFAVAFSK